MNDQQTKILNILEKLSGAAKKDAGTNRVLNSAGILKNLERSIVEGNDDAVSRMHGITWLYFFQTPENTTAECYALGVELNKAVRELNKKAKRYKDERS